MCLVKIYLLYFDYFLRGEIIMITQIYNFFLFVL